jgi:hypothetical protein
MASGHVNRTNRPNTWLLRPSPADVKKSLANPEPSTHGPTRPSDLLVACPIAGVKLPSRRWGATAPFDPNRKSSTRLMCWLSAVDRSLTLGGQCASSYPRAMVGALRATGWLT